MIIYYHRDSGRVIACSPAHVSTYQALEGTHLLSAKVEQPELTFLTCFKLKFDGKELVKDASSPTELISLLRRKCELLLRVQELTEEARRPYTKTLSGQEEIYAQKADEAKRYLTAPEADRAALLSNLPMLFDELEITGKPHKTGALEILRAKQERDGALRASEKARRSLTDKIGYACTLEELKAVDEELNDPARFKHIVIGA